MFFFLPDPRISLWQFMVLRVLRIIQTAPDMNPQEKTTSIHKKNQDFLLKTKKVRATWKKIEIKNFENFRSQKFQKHSLKIVWKSKKMRSKISKMFDLKNFKNVHWKLYENENRKFSISTIFRCQLQVALTFFVFNKSWWFFYGSM